MNPSEAYEARPQKARVGRIVVGVLVLLGKLSQLTIPPSDSTSWMGRFGLRPPVDVADVLLDVCSMLMWAIGVWLIVSGLPVKTSRR